MTKFMKEMISNLLYVLIVLGVAGLLVNFVGQRTEVDGASMEPTLADGDHLMVDKLSYRFHEPERFDIVVFPFQQEENTYYIKRIIGMPGETIQIDEKGNIYIDGKILEESYGREIIRADRRGLAAEPVKLEEDEYFVMGDNRNNSSDSRVKAVGNVKRKDVIGKAWLRIWPLSRFSVLKHQ